MEKSYTQRNCNLECLTNYTLSICDCVPYYLPRNKLIKVCSKNEDDCMNRAKEDMEYSFGNGSSCHCLAGCHEIGYNVRKSYSKLSEHVNISDELNNTTIRYFVRNMAIVHFYFPSTKFTALIKSELYGFTEILSNVGGLLGLCMGFSFLSIVEIFYFLSLRVLCQYVRLKSKMRKKVNINKPISDIPINNRSSVYPFIK